MQTEKTTGGEINASDPFGFNGDLNNVTNTSSTTLSEETTNGKDGLPPLGDWDNGELPTGKKPTEDIEVASTVGEKNGQEQYKEKVFENLYNKIREGEWFYDDNKTPLNRLAEGIHNITLQLTEKKGPDNSSKEIPFFGEIIEAAIEVQLAQSFPDSSSNKEIDSGVNKILEGTYPDRGEPSPLLPYPKSLIDRLVTHKLDNEGKRFGFDYGNASFSDANINDIKTGEEIYFVLEGLDKLTDEAPSVFEDMDSQNKNTTNERIRQLASDILNKVEKLKQEDKDNKDTIPPSDL